MSNDADDYDLLRSKSRDFLIFKYYFWEGGTECKVFGGPFGLNPALVTSARKHVHTRPRKHTHMYINIERKNKWERERESE